MGRAPDRSGVRAKLVPFLPSPRVLREDDGTFRLERARRAARRRSAGCARFVGSTGVLVRAYAYIRAHGASGLCEVSDDAVLAANYLKARLSAAYDIPFERRVQARVRGLGRDDQARAPASGRWTSPSG